ncbi:MAG: DMT family transporter [Erysipelotrichaceae bacterium]|nr:DMT family transporter [Erysipelotrichaceae bacterium]
MYSLLALLSGITLAVMVSLNGGLSAQYGTFTATAIIHLVGSLAAFIATLFQKEKKKILGHKPYWIYLGGVIGVFTVVAQNTAYGRISMTSIVALGLLGQTIMSLIVDNFGLFGMKKNRFRLTNIPGLIICFIGMSIMFDGSLSKDATTAIIMCLCSGFSIVLSRTVNARLANHIGPLRGSMVAHITGLPVTVIIALVASKGNLLINYTPSEFKPWIYMGGILGVTVILLSNITVTKLPAYNLTLLTFIGQVFFSLVLDILFGNTYSNITIKAGLIIAAGIGLNYLLDMIFKKETA